MLTNSSNLVQAAKVYKQNAIVALHVILSF